jgi:hypothetical protein
MYPLSNTASRSILTRSSEKPCDEFLLEQPDLFSDGEDTPAGESVQVSDNSHVLLRIQLPPFSRLALLPRPPVRHQKRHSGSVAGGQRGGSGRGRAHRDLPKPWPHRDPLPERSGQRGGGRNRTRGGAGLRSLQQVWQWRHSRRQLPGQAGRPRRAQAGRAGMVRLSPPQSASLSCSFLPHAQGSQFRLGLPP